MKPLALLLALAFGSNETPIEVRAPLQLARPLTPLHFGVNGLFSSPGLFLGTLPASDPRSKTAAFAAALRQSGIHTLRMPGGDAAYCYLPDDRSLTMKLAQTTGTADFRDDNPVSRDFVTLDNLALFTREHKLELIYQLPVLFHSDHGQSHAAIRSAFSSNAKNYDHDRIEAQADYAAAIAKRLRDLHAPVAAWELGNEEFAHCDGADYAKVAAAIVRRVRQFDAATPIVAIGMGEQWLAQCIAELRQQDVLEQIASFNVHYPFGTWPGPATPGDRANLSVFVQGDIQFTRWFDVATQQRIELGIPDAPMAVTETMVFKFDGPYWDSYRVIGTHAHALLYAWNWMTLLADPRCNMAVFHDLESPYFGMLRFDTAYDQQTGRFAWLATVGSEQTMQPFPGQYLLSPTCGANRLLSELIGYRAGLALLQPEAPHLRVFWGTTDTADRVMAVAVNRSSERTALIFPTLTIESAQSLTADDLGSPLPNQYRVTPLETRPDHPHRIDLPPWSLTQVRLR
jgi:hypothetical protein